MRNPAHHGKELCCLLGNRAPPGIQLRDGLGCEIPKLLLLCCIVAPLWSDRLPFSGISSFVFFSFLTYHFLVKADAFHTNVLAKIPVFSQKLL